MSSVAGGSVAAKPRLAGSPSLVVSPGLWALTRAEGWRLVRHPLFLVGLAVSVGVLALSWNDGDTLQYGVLLGYAVLFFGLAPWTLLVAFLATTRARRDAAEDLHDAAPVSTRTRTAAALLSLGWAAGAATLVLGVAWLLRIGLDGVIVIDGHEVRPGVLELAQGPLLVAAFGALGVMLARWVPLTFAGALAMLVVAFPPLNWFVAFVVQRQIPNPENWYHGDTAWHLVFILGIGGFAAAGALARDDRRWPVLLAAAIGLTGIVVGYQLGGPYSGAG